MSANIKRLDKLGLNESAVVHSIEGGHGVTGRLNSMGLHPGVTVSIVSMQPARGPVVVQVGGANRLALGRGIARKVMVEVKSK